MEKARWSNIDVFREDAKQSNILKIIQDSEMVIIFISKAFACDKSLILEKFAYTATVTRKQFIPVWLNSINDIQNDYRNDFWLDFYESLDFKKNDLMNGIFNREGKLYMLYLLIKIK